MFGFGKHLPVSREIPRNPEYILATKECLGELSQIGINLCASRLFDAIPAVVQDLGEYLQQNQNNLSPEVTWKFISVVKAADVRTQMEQACVEIMETILAIYSTEFLPMIFTSVPEANHLKARYVLSQDYITQQSLNGQNALKRNLSPVYSELVELSRVQEHLISSFSQLQVSMGDNSADWGHVARNVVGGAVTVANPLIGISILLSNYFTGNEKDNNKKAFINSWWDRFEEFLKRWDRVDSSYQPVYQTQCQFIEEKIKNVSEVAVPRILSELDAEGFNLKKVPATYQTFLSDIKQKYGIK